MIRYTSPLVGLSLFLLILGRYYSDQMRKDPSHNPHLTEAREEFESYIEREMERTQTPGAAVVIVKDTTTLLLKGFGVREWDTIDSVDIHTSFRIGSLSKGFAAALAAILKKEGRIAWEDPVDSYVPHFQLKASPQDESLTVLHVLSQRTGLPRHAFTNLIERRVNMDRIYKELRTVPLVGKVGKLYSYQNVAYNVISDISYQATGQSFSHLLHDKLFTPLHLNEASCSYPAMALSENKALPHYPYKSSWKVGKVTKKYYNAIPAGGINASISDMEIWLKVLLGTKPDILSDAELTELFTPRIFTNNRNRYFHRWPYAKKAYYGMGWRVVQDAQDTIIYHGGYVNGYRSEIAFNRKEKIGICILTNAPTELAPKAIPTFFDVYRIHKRSVHRWENKRHWAFSMFEEHPDTYHIMRSSFPSSFHEGLLQGGETNDLE